MLTPLAEAQRHVLDRCPVLTAGPVEIERSLGLVVAAPVVALHPIPPFANTAMDGYAVRSADVARAPVDLDVVGLIAAGHAPEIEVGPGQAVRIMTGAPMPPGADAVVMVEWTRAAAGPGDRVTIEVAVDPGQHVRSPGEDVEVGDEVVSIGTQVTPGVLGVLANVGARTVEAHPRPRVGVLSTGDELVSDGSELRLGQIRDSNRPTLVALVTESGFTPLDLGVMPDDPDVIRRGLLDGAERCDALITSGGVSMGDLDHVKVVLDEIGDMRWMQVAIRPAKPLAFGVVTATDGRGVPVFGLPGNPVSSMVSFELFARPGLRTMAGHVDVHRPTRRARAAEPFGRRPDGKTHYLRVQTEIGADGVSEVRSAGGQGSHQLMGMARADALAIVPDGDGIGAGDPVDIMALRG